MAASPKRQCICGILQSGIKTDGVSAVQYGHERRADTNACR